jgi:hypothetical protein
MYRQYSQQRGLFTGDDTPLMGKAEHPQVEQQMIVANDIQISR